MAAVSSYLIKYAPPTHSTTRIPSPYALSLHVKNEKKLINALRERLVQCVGGALSKGVFVNLFGFVSTYMTCRVCVTPTVSLSINYMMPGAIKKRQIYLFLPYCASLVTMFSTLLIIHSALVVYSHSSFR